MVLYFLFANQDLLFRVWFCFLNMKENELSVLSCGIMASLQEMPRVPAFVWLLFFLEASCHVTPPTFPDSSWASFFLPSFLAPSLLSVSPQWILILPFATQPSLAALFTLCLLYPAMHS